MNSSEESENHWPGYVDALTTMTMILIFVMMILSVAFFSVSSNVSRSLIEKIAETAGLALSPSNVTNEQVVNDVITQLATQRDARTLAAIQRTLPSIDTPIQTAQDLTPPIRPPSETIVQSEALAAAPPPAAPVRADAAETLLTLVYKPRAAGIDEAALGEIRAFVEHAKLTGPQARFDLRAYATPSTGAVSDSRRIAYYRAMTARNRLISFGIPASRISVLIEDRDNANQSDRLRIYLRDPGSLPANSARTG